MTRRKADRTKCPECGQMVLTYLSSRRGVMCFKGHCKPGTDPKKSIGCDCPGSYTSVLAAAATGSQSHE